MKQRKIKSLYLKISKKLNTELRFAVINITSSSDIFFLCINQIIVFFKDVCSNH